MAFQLLFSRLGLKERLRGCFRHNPGRRAYAPHAVTLLPVVHLILGCRELRDMARYRNDEAVRRAVGLQARPRYFDARKDTRKEPSLTNSNKLSPAFVKAARHSGNTRFTECHVDGNGLMLCIQPSGSKSWVQRIVIHGRRRTFGLGGYPLVALKDVRRMAFENRALARQGGDPLALRARRDIPDFATAAARVIDI